MVINVQWIALIMRNDIFFIARHEESIMIWSVFYAPVSAFLQPRNFCKVEFTYISNSRKKVRKITKMLWSFVFQLEFK